MCGRYVLVSDADDLAERFGVHELADERLPPRYNVAPGTDVYAVLQREGERRLGTLRWGFLPHWARSPDDTRRPINARLETVADSRMFADAFARRRCLVPADGFYEWQARGDGRRKQPYHIADPDGEPLALGGIWSMWRGGGDALATTAIVTTAARGIVADLHDRMPVILPVGWWDPWLSGEEVDAHHLVEEVAGLHAPRLVATAVSTRVNSVGNDGPELLEPYVKS